MLYYVKRTRKNEVMSLKTPTAIIDTPYPSGGSKTLILFTEDKKKMRLLSPTLAVLIATS